MSRSSVPDVYARVIKDVCEASRVDFEEGGVDLNALELLKQGWQKRLSAEHIATFPWDPKPELVAKAEPTPAPSDRKVPVTLPSNGAINTPPSSSSTPGPQIKQEYQQYATREPLQNNYTGPRYPQSQPQPQPQPHEQVMSAHQRAAMNLQEKFGNQASSQINQLQNQQRIPNAVHMQPQLQQPQQPYIKQEFKPDVKQDFKQEAGGSQDYQQNYGTSVPVKTSQVDGAADSREQYDTEIAQRRALVATHREAGDRLIRNHVLASQQSLEGGGLLLPLNSLSPRKSKLATTLKSNTGLSLSKAQGDAAGDEEEDEDAINSDLDDPDELDEANNGEDDVSNVMLCTYDKVQRVKNKWKCTLKDGVLKVDGSEFVFHKGQGEFEW